MIYRTLGRTGFSVSEISFGAWGIGGNWGTRDDAEAARALQRAFDLGVNFYDTALAYGQGLSEKFIGEFVKGRRAQVFVASKVPPKTYRWPVLPGEPVTQTFPKAWIIECTERSLKNLRTPAPRDGAGRAEAPRLRARMEVSVGPGLTISDLRLTIYERGRFSRRPG